VTPENFHTLTAKEGYWKFQGVGGGGLKSQIFKGIFKVCVIAKTGISNQMGQVCANDKALSVRDMDVFWNNI